MMEERPELVALMRDQFANLRPPRDAPDGENELDAQAPQQQPPTPPPQ